MEIIVLGLVGFFVIKFNVIGFIISWMRKSDAAASVQALLENKEKLFMFDGNPASAATIYVQEAWDSKPDVFNGKFGVRPHKLAVVIYSLALAVKKLDLQKDGNYGPVAIAYASASSELEVNGKYYNLSLVDFSLIKESLEMLAHIVERMEAPSVEGSINNLSTYNLMLRKEKQAKIEAKGLPYVHHDRDSGVFQMVDFPYKSYDEWNEVYTKAAIDSNPALAPTTLDDGSTVSILDLLDKAPCMRAYSHHLDPQILGANFGKRFNIGSTQFKDGVKTRDFIKETHGIDIY